MGKRIVRKLTRECLKLLNDFESAAIQYGQRIGEGQYLSDFDGLYRDEMKKARYRLEKKLLDQGELAAHGMRVLKAHRNKET